METLTLHTTRGTLSPSTLDEARALHNSFVTGGPQPGIEIARSLGDISHNVCTPAEGTGSQSGAKPGELLFIDYWTSTDGMETFFANPFAQQAADRLFSSREESEWTPAPGAFTFGVPTPAGTPARFQGIMRAPVRSADDATAVLGKLVWASLSAARRRGQLSHALFVRPANAAAARPASNARRGPSESLAGPADPAEILAVDTWLTLDGLKEHYADEAAMSGLGQALAGPPTTSVWAPASGFAEW